MEQAVSAIQLDAAKQVQIRHVATRQLASSESLASVINCSAMAVAVVGRSERLRKARTPELLIPSENFTTLSPACNDVELSIGLR